jgi:hypothetical protein
MVGQKTKKSYVMASKIHVNIHKVDRVKRLMDFRPVVEKTPPQSTARAEKPAEEKRPKNPGRRRR